MNRLEMCQISIQYPESHAQALNGAWLRADHGVIHGLVGENGAGKTTLIKILCGLEQPDQGELWLDGKRITLPTSLIAFKHGIGMVHQHFRLIDDFTVAQNVVLGVEPRGRPPFLISKRINHDVLKVCQQSGLFVDPGAKVGHLTMGQKQKVDILRLLYRDVDILALDEPTSVLNDKEVDELFATLTWLKKQGKTIIFVTHKLSELMRLADEVTVLRQGKTVFQSPIDQADAKEIAYQMVGKVIYSIRGDMQPMTGRPTRLETRNLSVLSRTKGESGKKELLQDISFTVREGEILGIGGVSGNGQLPLAQALFGLLPIAEGEILLDGQPVHAMSTAGRRRMGMGYIPEDRLYQGASLYASITENLIVDRFHRKPFSKGFIFSWKQIHKHVSMWIETFGIHPHDSGMRVGLLSGGNIQKTVLAREISAQPKALIVCEPTWGLDVGATEKVHQQLLDIRAHKAAVILITTNLQELIHLSDRLLIMYKGKIVKSLLPEDIRQGKIDEQRFSRYLGGLHGLDGPKGEEIHETLW